MAQKIKALDAESEKLGLVHWTHIVGMDWLPQIVLQPIHICSGTSVLLYIHMLVHTYINTYTEFIF